MAFWKKNKRNLHVSDVSRPRFRKLACETLETRNLLSCSPLGSVEPFYGPIPASYEVLLSPVSGAETRPEIIAIPELIEVPKSIEGVPEILPVMGPMPVYFSTPLSLYSSAFVEEDLVQSSFQESSDESDGVRVVDRTELEALTPAFYVDGVAQYSFSDVLAQVGSGARRVVFSDSASDVDSSSDDAVVIPYDADDSSDDDLPQRSGGGDPEVWNLSLTVDSSHTDSGLSTSVTPNAMIERLGVDVNAPDPLAGANCLTITAPALPSDYVSTVSFSGSATPGVDYAVYGSLLNVNLIGASGSIEYSGGPLVLYVVPLNDAIVESAESVTATLDAPYVPGSGGPVYPHTFTYGTTTVSGTIIDDDHWNFVAEQLDDEGEPIPAASSSEIMIQEPENAEDEVTPVLFRVSRSNIGDSPDGDLSYPVSVTVGVNGSATASGNNHDFSLWSWNGSLSSILSPVVSTLGALFTIEFPAGIESLSLAIIPSFDGIVESLYETLEISVLSAVSANVAGGVYSTSETDISYAIADSDVFTLDEVSFLNNLNLISDTAGSFNESWQTGPHWKRNLPAFTKPIAYPSGSNMGISASITGGRDSYLIYEIKAFDSLGGETQWVQVSGDVLTLWFTETFSELLEGARAYYNPNYSLTWYFRVNGGDSRLVDVGDNSNSTTLYVTYGEPVSGTTLYHTVVHHSCVAASEALLISIDPEDSSEQIEATNLANMNLIYAAICGKFASLSVEKINWINGSVSVGSPLTYYGKDVVDQSDYVTIKNTLSYTYRDGDITFDQFPSRAREYARRYMDGDEYLYVDDCFRTDGLLRYEDGTCGAWQNFFVDVLRTQGLDSVTPVYVSVEAIQVPNASSSNACFKVKTNIRGQGNIIPHENTWRNHAIVKYRKWFFDPSYGVNYGVMVNNQLQSIKQGVISNLDSIGRYEENPYAGYGLRYVPLVDSNEITISQIRISANY